MHILHKYCTNYVQILYKILFENCRNIGQILYKYCTNIDQILYKYYVNIVQILQAFCKYCTYTLQTFNILYILHKYCVEVAEMLKQGSDKFFTTNHVWLSKLLGSYICILSTVASQLKSQHPILPSSVPVNSISISNWDWVLALSLIIPTHPG